MNYFFDTLLSSVDINTIKSMYENSKNRSQKHLVKNIMLVVGVVTILFGRFMTWNYRHKYSFWGIYLVGVIA